MAKQLIERSQSNDWLKFHLDQIYEEKLITEKFPLIALILKTTKALIWYGKQYSAERATFEAYPYCSKPFSSFHMISMQSIKLDAYYMNFNLKSKLTSSASPMLVFYTIFNKAVFLPKLFLP